MKKLMQWAVALCSAAMLAACGGGGDGGARTVTADPVLALNAETGRTMVSALATENFTFPSGVPAFGTAAATTVTFSAPATPTAAPGFTITSGTNTASGTMAFGSCIFRVTASTFPATHPLARGKVVTINPCNVSVTLKGTPADGVATSRSVALVLGAAVSAGAPVTVGVNGGGQLTFNGAIVGSVTLSPLTGAF